MKSTKTIFAVSSIRFIKPLNSSSSCSLEQIYFGKKTNKQKDQNIFIKCCNEKKEKKRKFQFSGYAQRTCRLIQVHDQIFVVVFILCSK
jgi:hypothetical protein